MICFLIAEKIDEINTLMESTVMSENSTVNLQTRTLRRPVNVAPVPGDLAEASRGFRRSPSPVGNSESSYVSHQTRVGASVVKEDPLVSSQARHSAPRVYRARRRSPSPPSLSEQSITARRPCGVWASSVIDGHENARFRDDASTIQDHDAMSTISAVSRISSNIATTNKKVS